MRWTLLLLVASSTIAHADVPGWGTRSQIGQMRRTIDDPNRVTTIKPTFVARQPLLQKLAAYLRPGFASAKKDIPRLQQFLKDSERDFEGREISTFHDPALKNGLRMRVEKALALKQFNRQPNEVTEELIDTQATVGDTKIAARKLFVQRWRPSKNVAPSGKVFVIAPGFLETGRNYYEQAQLLNDEGHEVVILDQQWAGYTADAQKGVVKGAIDRGFGVARDVAEAAAYGNEILKAEYASHPGKQLVLVGTSMGGGPGVLDALTLYDHGRIDLGKNADGSDRQIPADRGWILQDAFLARTPSFINNALDFTGRIPVVRNVPLYATGLPLLSDDPRTNVKIAAHAVQEDVRGRPQAFRAALHDIDTVNEMLKRGLVPKGRGFVIHTQKDHLAKTQAIVDAVDALKRGGASVAFEELPGADHVIEETAGEQRMILKAASYVAR